MAGRPESRAIDGAPPAPGASGSWPPFEAGNTAALTHGAYSPRRVDPRARELVEQLLDFAAHRIELSYLGAVQYRSALWAWARAEVIVELLDEWLDEHGGDIDNDGEVYPAANLREKVERRAVKLRERLGLDPLSRARLGRDVAASAVDVARVMAEGDGAGPGPTEPTALDVPGDGETGGDADGITEPDSEGCSDG